MYRVLAGDGSLLGAERFPEDAMRMLRTTPRAQRVELDGKPLAHKPAHGMMMLAYLSGHMGGPKEWIS